MDCFSNASPREKFSGIILAACLFIGVNGHLQAQNNAQDLTYGSPIILDSVTVTGTAKPFTDQEYQLLKRSVYKVWPYALIGVQYLEEILEKEKENSRRENKKTVSEVEDQVKDNFADVLKKMNQRDGRILIKLIHRQTGMTTFEIAKTLKSGWRAFWWNTTAGVFNLSLKAEYNPQTVYEDNMIEHILREGFTYGVLQVQVPYTNQHSYFNHNPNGDQTAKATPKQARRAAREKKHSK